MLILGDRFGIESLTGQRCTQVRAYLEDVGIVLDQQPVIANGDIKMAGLLGRERLLHDVLWRDILSVDIALSLDC